jgi:DNA replication protein DnaC
MSLGFPGQEGSALSAVGPGSHQAPAGGPTATSASSPCPYGTCDGSGFVIDESTNTATDCRCRAGQIAKRRSRRLEARIPSRYREISFEQLKGTDLVAFPEQIRVVRRFAARIEENLDLGRGVWIMGDVGTGKTMLAMLISKAALDAGRTVAIYSLPRLLGLIRESIDDKRGVIGFLDLLASVDLLHIDDVGVENRTDWVLEQLYSIINSRYEQERSVVLTTNLEPSELAEQIGARTVSRLVEMCGDPLPLFGEDRRRELPSPLRTA